MQVTETGYYETRDGGLAYVCGFAHESIRPHYPAVGYYKSEEGWEYTTWNLEGLQLDPWNPSNLDLIRYIGKELPIKEEKPQPECVELSKLWVGWIMEDGCYVKSRLFYPTKEAVLKDFDGTFEVIAITPADAQEFFVGEGLE